MPAVASGQHLYLFDPCGAYLASSIGQADSAVGADGGDAPRGGTPIGRAYPMVPDELPRRFPDQFDPLRLFGWQPGTPMDGTLLRLPLRSHAQVTLSRALLCTQATTLCIQAVAACSQAFR